jgi:sugar (pentulose or hexulose) kinase
MREAGHPNLARMLGHVSPELGIAKLAAMARAGELDRPGADLVVELGDWLSHRLTGSWVASSGTREGGWAGGDTGEPPGELLAAADVDPRLVERTIPLVQRTGTIAGEVTAGVALRMPALGGAQVVTGGMDSYLAALGCGAAEPGRMCVTVGSSSAVVVGLAAGRADGRLFGPLRTILPGDRDGFWHGGQTTAGLAASWAASVLGARPATLEHLAAASPPGARGVAFVETLLDRRTPRPASPLTGAWTGLRLDHTRGDLYRAVLEGVALGLADACAGLRPAAVVATGGLLRSGVFRQALADALELPIHPLAVPSAPALGAAFADDPARPASFARPTRRPVLPSGADYRDLQARRIVAGALETGDGGADE